MCAYLFFILFFLYWRLHWFSPLQIVHVEFFLVCVESVSFNIISFFCFVLFFGRWGEIPNPLLAIYPPPPLPTFISRFPPLSNMGVWGGGAGSSVPCGLHLSASIATLAFCSAPVCGFTPVGQAGPGCVGGCPWVQSPCGACGTLGTFDETPQPPTWWGGGEVAMAAAMGLPPLPLLKLSEAFSRENIVNASGKLGGVAGVLAGVHIWGWRGKKHNNNQCRSPKQEYTHPHRAVVVY